jgi:hypothetical protein
MHTATMGVAATTVHAAGSPTTAEATRASAFLFATNSNCAAAQCVYKCTCHAGHLAAGGWVLAITPSPGD